MKTVADQFSGGNIVLADNCTFNSAGFECYGGAADFATDDGITQSNRYLEELHELDEIFPSYDAGGNRITPHRILDNSNCNTQFLGDNNCAGSCTPCDSIALKAKCRARQLKCKAQNTEGLSIPFLEDPASAIGLFSGKDIQIIDFSPPDLIFTFEYAMAFVLYTPPTVQLDVFFEFTVTVKFGIVLDTKGIREAVEEKNFFKALESFAFKDTFDGGAFMHLFEIQTGVHFCS